jgi:hypothetical protein
MLHLFRFLLNVLFLFAEFSSEAIIECMTTYSTSSNARLANLAKIYLQVLLWYIILSILQNRQGILCVLVLCTQVNMMFVMLL